MIGLRVGAPATVGDLELIPIERTLLDGRPVAGGLMVFAAKEPAGIVVRSPLGDRAFSFEGSDPEVMDLLRAVLESAE